MQQYITKLCADSLRAFTYENWGEKLHASHAHELVAALFGYKSRAALLADRQLPLDNLQQAEFIIFDPTPCNTGLVGQRLKDFGYGSFTAFQLADCFYKTLRKEKWLSEKLHLSCREVAIHVAGQYLHQRLKMLGISPGSIKWDIDGYMFSPGDNGNIKLIADINYRTDAGELLKDSQYIIYLTHVAANLAYRTLSVHETRYTGGARKFDFLERKIS